tara:strand:+ start:137 stop:754 length:618 start_codon:yes stop_codon:yes gene_type:complete
MFIGLDFDNTIVDYNKLFFDLAKEDNLIKNQTILGKREIKKFLLNSDMHDKWQILQSKAYGKRMNCAILANGFKEFILFIRANKIPVSIVSHKTKYSNFTLDKKVNLREASIDWMKKNNFFSQFKFTKSDIFFENTREDKVKKIKELKFTHFIDDLEEVFNSKNWPLNTSRLLLNRYSSDKNSSIIHFKSWNDILINFKKNFLVA